MADRRPRPGFRFPGPVPAEALEYFDAKDLRVGFSHRDVSGLEHACAFTAAKVVQLDILDDLRTAIREHLAEGRTFESFRKELTPVLQAKGWWGRKRVIDPRTGRTVEAQLGSPRRLRTVFRANIRAARAAGQWARIQRTKDALPFLLYQLGPSREHRDKHLAWNGTLLPADDPWWRDHCPPNGWGCKCWVRQVDRREAQRLGGPTDPPRRDMRGWTNPRTGRKTMVDRGLDPEWASNPGLDRERILADRLNGTLDAADEDLAREAVRQVVESPLLERQVARMRPGDPPKGDLPVAYLEPERRRQLDVDTAVIGLDQAGVKHVRKRHREITVEDWRRLPGMLAEAQDVFPETGHFGRTDRDLVFFHRTSEGILFKAVVTAKGRGRVRVTSFGIAKESNLRTARRRARKR